MNTSDKLKIALRRKMEQTFKNMQDEKLQDTQIDELRELKEMEIELKQREEMRLQITIQEREKKHAERQ